jgi:hypothetical protein
MRTEELILAVILSLIIVADFRYPDSVNKLIKSPVGLVVVLAAILYLFTKSSVLGVLGLIAGYLMVQRAGSFASKYSAHGTRLPLPQNDQPMSNAVTLEETIISNMIPVTNSPGSATYSNTFSDVKNAASALNVSF